MSQVFWEIPFDNTYIDIASAMKIDSHLGKKVNNLIYTFVSIFGTAIICLPDWNKHK